MYIIYIANHYIKFVLPNVIYFQIRYNLFLISMWVDMNERDSLICTEREYMLSNLSGGVSDTSVNTLTASGELYHPIWVMGRLPAMRGRGTAAAVVR